MGSTERATSEQQRPYRSLLEAGALPMEDLAVVAWREGIRPRAIYGAHKWFARRFGTAFRALLVGSALGKATTSGPPTTAWT